MAQEVKGRAGASRLAPRVEAELIDGCLRKDAARRYQTAGELHAALEVAQAGWLGA